MATERHLEQYDKDGNRLNIYLNEDEVKVGGAKTLGRKLSEMDEAIEEAAQAGYAPPDGGIPQKDLSQSVQDTLDSVANKVDKEEGKGLSANDYTDAEKQKLAGLQNYNDTALQSAINSLRSELDTLIGSGNVQGAIDTFNEVVAFLNGINSSDTLAAKLALKANAADVVKSVSVNGTAQSKDQNGNVNIQVQAGGESIVFDTEGTPIIDSPLSPNADTVLGAASARWVKEIDNNVKAILAALAGIAFTNTKPTWEAVAKRKYNLTMTALTGCTGEVVSSDAGNGQVYEGGVRIKLTPTQASYAFTSVTVNGESVATTATGDADGSVYLDIVVNGNINVAATAVSGRAITFNGTGCMIGAQAVVIGQDLDATITANEHFTLPQSITVKIGNTDVAHTYTRAQGNKTATLHIDAANITGDLTIICTAVEDDFAVLDLDEVGSNVAVMRDSESLLGQSTPPHVYAGETISILPVGNNKVSATVTIGGNTVTLDGDTYDGFSYTLQSNDVSSSGTSIAITATATGLVDCAIALPSTGSGIASVALTDLNGSAIQSPVKEGSGIKIVLTPDTDYAINNISIANMTEGDDYDVTDSNGAKTIIIQHVTGNVVVTATASQPQKVTIQYNTDKWRKTPSVTQVNEGVETPIVIEPMDTFKLAEVKYTIDGGSEQTGTIVDNACTLVVTANTSLKINTKSVMDVVLGYGLKSGTDEAYSVRTKTTSGGNGCLYTKSYIPLPNPLAVGQSYVYAHQLNNSSPAAVSGVCFYNSSKVRTNGFKADVNNTRTIDISSSTSGLGSVFFRATFRYSDSGEVIEERSFTLNGDDIISEDDIVAAINYKLANS